MVADELFSVIAERTRRDILSALADEAKAVGQLVDDLGVSQPTVSKHLRVLREAGVVTIRAQGQKRYYSINTEPLNHVAAWLNELGATPAGSVGKSAAKSSASQAKIARPNSSAQSGSDAQVGADSLTSATEPANPLSDLAGTARTGLQPGHSDANAAARGGADKVGTSVNDRKPSAAAQGRGPASKVNSGSAPAASAQPLVASNNFGMTGGVPGNGMPEKAGVAARQAAVLPSVSSTQSNGEPNAAGQLSRSVGRAANRAADLLANLPKIRRRKD